MKIQFFSQTYEHGLDYGRKRGILLQAGFYENEIDAIISSQSTFETSSIEDRALSELNESVERVKEEFENHFNKYINGIINGKTASEVLSDFNTEILLKLELLFKKEGLI